MTDDARFEDGRESPLNLGAQDTDDLQVISSLCQDAVFPITEMQQRETPFFGAPLHFRDREHGILT